MRKRITYANVAATLALVLSMSGGAFAATHYLINTTKQINPKVLKKLKGATGKTGPTGKEGPQGKEGPTGKEGPQGKEGVVPATLQAGHSESGDWAVAGAAGEGVYMATGVAFPEPLATSLEGSHVQFHANGSTSSQCPGLGSAAAGYLCVYETESGGASPSSPPINEQKGFAGADSYGFFLFFDITEEDPYAYGSWTVTAA